MLRRQFDGSRYGRSYFVTRTVTMRPSKLQPIGFPGFAQLEGFSARPSVAIFHQIGEIKQYG